MKNNHPVGKFGEDIAVRFLEKRGFCIIERNVYMRGGEIDIVAKDGTKTVFIEVKTRFSLRQGGAIYAFSPGKFYKFYKAVLVYQQYKHVVDSFRLDFLAVQINPKTNKVRLRHFKNISRTSFTIG